MRTSSVRILYVSHAHTRENNLNFLKRIKFKNLELVPLERRHNAWDLSWFCAKQSLKSYLQCTKPWSYVKRFFISSHLAEFGADYLAISTLFRSFDICKQCKVESTTYTACIIQSFRQFHQEFVSNPVANKFLQVYRWPRAKNTELEKRLVLGKLHGKLRPISGKP